MKKTSPRADFSREKNVRSKGVQNTNELVGSNESKRIRQAALKALSSSKDKCFQTDKYKTRNSSWTPVVNPYCNSEVSFDKNNGHYKNSIKPTLSSLALTYKVHV